jgi:acetyl esterase/lipase
MKNIVSFLILLMMSLAGFTQLKDTSSLARAQKLPSYIERPEDGAGIFAIYPGKGIPAGSEKWTTQERTIQVPGDRMARNIVIPTVTVFQPAEGTANGTALIVAPGGAFHFLMMENEGYNVARWLTKLGITAFVLKYRVQHTPENDADLQPFLDKLFTELPKVSQTEIYPPLSHPGAEEARLWGEEDGQQAIRFVRQNAKELGIARNKIGIMGFSAGGGISVNAAFKCDSLSRPDFVGAIYAGYRIVSPIPLDLPPLFIAITDDDKSVAPISLARLYEDWHKAGKSVELHIFASGEHGFGMKQQKKLPDQWVELFKNWLAAQGFLSPIKK